MADKEKNMPIEDPKNLESEIMDVNSAEEPVEEVVEETAAEEAVAEEIAPEVEEQTPAEDTAEEAPVEEPAEEEAAEQPVEEESAEEPGEESAEEEPAESDEAYVVSPEDYEPASYDDLGYEPAEVEPALETPAEEPAAETEVEAASGEPTDEPVEAAAEPVAEEAAEESIESGPAAEADEPAAEESVESEPVAEADEPDAEEGETETAEGGYFDGGGSDGFDGGDSGGFDGGDSGGSADDDPDFDDPDDTVDPDDLIIHDELVDAIIAEGARLTKSEMKLKAYLKHSKDAIKSFESALKIAQRAFDDNRDDREAPVLLVAIIKICGKILEIKCNNLENIVRINAHNYIKEARVALHYEIDRYNELVISYASLTGEQLTRMSTLLPENIASGKSLAVVPSLSYVESYVQVDDAGKGDDGVYTMPITPVYTADELIGDIKPPKGRHGTASFARRVKRGTSKLNREKARLNKLISDNRILRKRYESELHSLEASTTLADRTTDDYKDRVLAISIKYGKKLSGIKTVKAGSAFARTRQSLIINRMAVEREKLILAYQNMRVAYREGKPAQRRAARRLFEDAIRSYNQAVELTEKATGGRYDRLPDAIVEYVGSGREVDFPIFAYNRRLIETVGSTVREIGMTPRHEVEPDEATYAESSAKILEKRGSVSNTASLSDESAIVDRASAIARVMIDSLREAADTVVSIDELEAFEAKSRRAVKYFKRALKGTERAIAKAFDENGVVTALVENLRVLSNIIEVRRLNVAVCKRLDRTDAARRYGSSLFKYIELYDGRAIDYMSIVGEQFSRITTATAKELVGKAENLQVPVITYKDNYIEVFPKDPLKDSTYEKPRLWRSGVYTPLMMHHFRLTENRAVETTVINAPFVFDVMTDELPAISWWHPIGFLQHLFVWAQPIVAWWNRMVTNAEIWFVDESLVFSKSGLKGRENRNDKRKDRFERKLARLNNEREAAILRLETVVHESDRNSASYQKKIYNINTKYSRKIYNLRVRWMKSCPDRNAARLMLERLVLERERLSGINKVLLKYRSYGRITFFPNVLVRYKKKFIDSINAHNRTAEQLSEMVGVKFSQVSTSVAEEIIRYGRMIKLPEIVCCREIIETVGGRARTVGDKWHGYGLYTGTSGAVGGTAGAPVMSVGAMGYATEMGVPFLKSNFDGLTLIGMTPGGVPLIGFSQTGEAAIPFTGIPMMLAGTDTSVVLDAGMQGQDSLILGAASVTDPHSGISNRAVDNLDTDEAEEEAKDIRSGCTVETPLDLESKMIEERFRRALRARSMTSVDNVANWWKLVGSEINVWFMRKLHVRPQGFLRVLLPRKDEFLEIVNTKLTEKDAIALKYIARVGGVIEIECKRLYSATKTGVRRSQRVWSRWLHEDIEVYNKLVREFNSEHERYMHLELLSLNIPDTIRFRTEDRPPVPPILSLRNRVKLDESKTAITTDEIYEKLVEYARSGAIKHAGPLRRFWSKLVTIPRINRNYKRGKKAKVLSLVTKVIIKRSARTYLFRQDNENRHYRIRYEKARAMKRYNRRTLRAIGVAGDPIKYQAKVHKVLRKYLTQNFRIDYNMRIRQLIYRALTVERGVYWAVTLALAVVVAVGALIGASSPTLQTIAFVAICWAALPIVLLLLRIVYDIVLFVVSVVLLCTRNIWLIKYGGRDVERNRYGAILDCFVSEQYRLLMAAEKLHQKPKSQSAKRMLIATVNDYNKRATVYSEILRVPIRTVEITSLIEKITSGENHRLTELQNFVYVRELVERTDSHQVGKRLSERELGILVEEINQIINGINLSGDLNQSAVDFLQGAMQRLIGFLETDIKPTQNDKYELKRDLITAIGLFDISISDKELFTRNVIKVVDQLGGSNRRRIIGILAEDGMII